VLSRAYAIAAYAAFLVSNVWAFLFLGNWFIGVTVDSAPRSSPLVAVIVDAGVLGLFALQHSIMARESFKRWWASAVTSELSRSTYVLLASLLLFATFAFWQPIAGTCWSLSGAAAVVVAVLYVCGWALTLGSTFLLDHAELFGLRRTIASQSNKDNGEFRTPGLYRTIRHPMMLGLVVLFWSSPIMTVGHLLFAGLSTGYILVGIWFEERDLVVAFGERYVQYQKNVPMLLPRIGKKKATPTDE